MDTVFCNGATRDPSVNTRQFAATRVPQSGSCHIDWLIGLLPFYCFLYMPMLLMRLAKASVTFSIASELELYKTV